MPLIKTHAFRHHLSKWPIVLPLYDGRRCPDCAAVVLGWQSQQQHKQREAQFDALDQAVRQLVEAVRVLADQAGLAVRMAPVEAGGEDDDEGLEVDERLTRKARIVIGEGALPPEMTGGED